MKEEKEITRIYLFKKMSSMTLYIDQHHMQIKTKNCIQKYIFNDITYRSKIKRYVYCLLLFLAANSKIFGSRLQIIQ